MWMEGISSSPVKQIIKIGWKINGRYTTMKGLFGDLFDFNHDGKMSAFERQMEMEMQRIEKLNRKKLMSGADFI